MAHLGHLTSQIRRFADARVACVGDLMLDRFIYGKVDRISPEAPIPVLRVSRDLTMLGGVGNVVRNIHSIGGSADLLAVVGPDEPASQIRRLVGQLDRCHGHLIESAARQTTIKTRYIGSSQQMLRVDQESLTPIDPAIQDQLLAELDAILGAVGVLVISDYGKGVLTDRLLRALIDRAGAAGVQVIVDPKGTDYTRYRGATLITPNLKELREATGCNVDDDASVVQAAEQLIADCRVHAILATRGERGMTLVRSGSEPVHLPAEAREVFDVSGAGDTVVATLAAALAAGFDWQDAIGLANVAAGIVVGKVGTAVPSVNELAHALRQQDLLSTETHIMPVSEATELIERWRAGGQTVGFTNGCFDLLHPGHVTMLAACASRCDRLVVGLNTDASIKRLKGPTRPIQDEMSRATVLASLASVDMVVLFDDDTPLALIQQFKPDVLMKGADYTVQTVVGSDVVLGYGGQVELIELVPDQSTSRLVRRMEGQSSDDA